VRDVCGDENEEPTNFFSSTRIKAKKRE